MLYQVLFKSKAHAGVFNPHDGRTIFTSVAEAQRYMAAHAMYPIGWTESGSKDYPAYGRDDRATGYEYMITRLGVFGNSDAVVVPVAKIAEIKDLLERMERRLIEMGDMPTAIRWVDRYPGQTSQEVADHKMEVGL